ncbi:MAG: LemA family protein [Planctomycetaceae bacterium]|jgi:hypothetical protein|nr:LemA family protein [Planctomycetaceae bacterium]
MIPLFVIAVILVVGLLLRGSISSLKRRRLLEDLPTSKTAGVFIGFVELKGTAESESPLVSFLAEKRCVWYSWDVQEHWSRTVTETHTGKDGKTHTRTRTESGWTTVASGGDRGLFYLQDDLGAVRINPHKAEIHAQNVFSRTCSEHDPLYYGKGPASGIMNSTGSRSFTEQAILLHQPLYIVGQSRERSDCVAAEIAYDRSAPIFMISVSTEESHRNWGLWKFWLLGLLAVLIPSVAGIAMVRHESDPLTVTGVPAALGGTVLLLWGIGWFWMVYNSLTGLKNRVKMATANMDVEFKRRFDLIPQILGVVEGMQKQEREVQETVARLRHQSGIKAVPNTGASVVQGCANRLAVLAESYPELKSNELFMALHRNLTETEQRIALARHYYNDVIETYNNRRERFPENLIVSVAGMPPIPLFLAEDFERAPVDVQFAE